MMPPAAPPRPSVAPVSPRSPEVPMLARRLLPLTLAAALAGCGDAPMIEVPVMALSANVLAFAATAGQADPAAQVVTVTNAGGGTLGVPVVQVVYGSGAGWLTATVAGGQAPYAVTVRPTVGALAAGTYTATVRVASSSAGNSPLSIAVTFQVAAAPVVPALVLSATAVEFRAASPGDATAPQAVIATSSTSAALATPAASVSYPAGGPSGWLTVGVAAAAAGYDLTFQADSTGLPLGLATATVEVVSAGATGSPQVVAVTLWVGRVVEVQRLLTWWAEDGATQELEDPAVTGVAFLQDDGAGGLARVVAQPGPAAGHWLAALSPGAYWAEVTRSDGPLLLVQADVELLDLGEDRGGRPTTVAAAAATPVTLNLSGLDPWAPGDVLRLASWGAQAGYELLPGFGLGNQDDVASLDWASTLRTLLVPADVLQVGQYRYNFAETNPSFSYLEALATTTATGLDMVSGAPLDATPAPATLPTLASVQVDWRRDAMEAAAAPFAQADAGFAHRLGLYAIPAPLAAPSPLGGTAVTVLESVDLAGSADILVSAATIGRFLPASWHEYQEVAFAVPVNRVAAGAGTPAPGTANLVRARVEPPASGLAEPLVGAPASPTVDGLPALLPGNVISPAPTVAWTVAASPAGAAPTSHRVRLFELAEVALATKAIALAEFVLAGSSTSLKVPAGLLQPGREYLLEVVARVSPADAGGATPLRTVVPEGVATTWTEVLSTAP